MTICKRLVRHLRATRRDRHRARATYRRLADDLASYRAEADVNDLLAALSHHDTVEAEQIRTILTGNRAHRSGFAA